GMHDQRVYVYGHSHVCVYAELSLRSISHASVYSDLYFASSPCYFSGLLLNLLFVELTFFFFFSSRRRHTRLVSDWSSDVCSSDLARSIGVSERTRAIGIPDTRIQRELVHPETPILLAPVCSPTFVVFEKIRCVDGEIGRASCRERV